MKRPLHIGLLLMALVVIGMPFGCNKDETPALFDMVYVMNFELPAALNTIQTHFVEFDKVPTNIEAYLADHGLTAADIGRIEPYDAQLEVVLAPESLAYFQEIFVELLDGNTRLECFYTPNVPFNTGTQVIMVGTLADFKPWLTQSAMNLRMGFRLREPSPTSLNFILRLTFKAKA